MTSHSPSLPADHAFVVQFRAGGAGAESHEAGRVEHLVSGHTTRFQSWAELQGFIRRMLAEVRP